MGIDVCVHRSPCSEQLGVLDDLATLFATANLNGGDPYAWLKLTLDRVAAGRSSHEIDALMPWNHHQPRTAPPGRLRIDRAPISSSGC